MYVLHLDPGLQDGGFPASAWVSGVYRCPWVSVVGVLTAPSVPQDALSGPAAHQRASGGDDV